MLTKEYTAEFKALDGGKPGEFEAIVAVFDNVDRQGDRIKSGAFDRTLKAWRKSGDPIPVILAHQDKDPMAHIGVADPKDVKVIPGRGLYAKGTLDIDDNPVARQVYRLMQRRSLKEFSFGYRPFEGGEKRASDGAYDLTDLDLFEFGPCLKGANDETELLAVKSALADARAEEDGRPTLAERLARIEHAIAGKAWVDVEMPGSFEDLRDELQEACREGYAEGDDTWVEVVATFPDRVVFKVTMKGEEDVHYSAPYSRNDEDEIELGDATPVEVTATITSKQDSPGETRGDTDTDEGKPAIQTPAEEPAKAKAEGVDPRLGLYESAFAAYEG